MEYYNNGTSWDRLDEGTLATYCTPVVVHRKAIL